MERFWSKVEKTDSCWLWIAARDRKAGYGTIGYQGKVVKAHRLAYEMLVGPIPSDREIDHLCRVRNCVNPEHLELVTHAENMRRRPPTTHCVNGHEYDEANTHIDKRGAKDCRKCNVIHVREWRQRQKLLILTDVSQSL